MAAIHRIERLEQEIEERATLEGDLAARLRDARHAAFTPPFTRAELDELDLCPPEGIDSRILRIARGLLRAELWREPVERALPAIDPEQTVIDVCGALALDPLKWVLFAFDWGCGELKNLPGPRQWQREFLADLGVALRSDAADRGEVIQRAVASGNGPGKSALVAILILFSLSTFEGARVVATASTESQLRNKTWPELAKWHRGCISGDWFTYAATALTAKGEQEKNWRGDAIPWNEQRPESFAGLHNARRRITLLFDEASGIADPVWDVARGSLTDAYTEMLWFAFGNPLRGEGEFHRAITKDREPWHARNLDTRTVEGISQTQINSYVESYGLDSDFVRTRVLGLPPRASSMQFIGRTFAEEAARRVVPEQSGYPAVLGVDIARHGDDETVIWTRRGLDARSFEPIRMREANLMVVASRVASHILQLQKLGLHVVTFLDATGLGVGVYDRLIQLRFVNVIPIQFGGRAVDPRRYFNMKAEMYDTMKTWLAIGTIPGLPELLDDLVAPQFGYDNVQGRLQIEKKIDVKRRLGRSPDLSDALALTFAQEVAPDINPEMARERAAEERRKRDYDPFDPAIIAR